MIFNSFNFTLQPAGAASATTGTISTTTGAVYILSGVGWSSSANGHLEPVNGLGITWTLVDTLLYSAAETVDWNYCVWVGVCSSGATGTITVYGDNTNHSNGAYFGFVIDEITGVDTTTLVIQFASVSKDSTSPTSVSLSAFANSSNYVYTAGFIDLAATGQSLSPKSGYTAITSKTSSKWSTVSSRLASVSAYKSTEDLSPNISWTGTWISAYDGGTIFALELAVGPATDASVAITTSTPTISADATVATPISTDVAITTTNPTISADATSLSTAEVAITTTNPTISVNATSLSTASVAITTSTPTITASATPLSTVEVAITTTNPTISANAVVGNSITASVSLTTTNPTINANILVVEPISQGGSSVSKKKSQKINKKLLQMAREELIKNGLLDEEIDEDIVETIVEEIVQAPITEISKPVQKSVKTDIYKYYQDEINKRVDFNKRLEEAMLSSIKKKRRNAAMILLLLD